MKNNKNYNIVYLDSFYSEFEEIIYYISYKLKNKTAAKNLINKVENSINNLLNNPKMFEIYKSKKIRENNWYRVYVGNFIIFYTVLDSKIIISHIIYGRRDIENLI